MGDCGEAFALDVAPIGIFAGYYDCRGEIIRWCK
jgi:hypothetical protein